MENAGISSGGCLNTCFDYVDGCACCVCEKCANTARDEVLKEADRGNGLRGEGVGET